jgi:hypothetical protein
MSGVSPQCVKLQREIEHAFASVKYPGDDQLVYNSSGQHLECKEVAEAFRGKHWKALSLETLSHHSSGLFFLTPEAYRFYLPAYLISGSLHYDEAEGVADSVVFSLIPPSAAKDIALYGALSEMRIGSLSLTQRNAIRAFLQFLKEHHSEDDPLGNIDKALAIV